MLVITTRGSHDHTQPGSWDQSVHPKGKSRVLVELNPCSDKRQLLWLENAAGDWGLELVQPLTVATAELGAGE